MPQGELVQFKINSFSLAMWDMRSGMRVIISQKKIVIPKSHIFCLGDVSSLDFRIE
jgi:hypothetical protein